MAASRFIPSQRFPYSGIDVRGYQYRRYEAGAKPMWTPLRFPGQYYDAETELHENWHRYYDPVTGRYLQPEPMLANPRWVVGQIASGMSTPVYAYAGNNPVMLTDPTGLVIVQPEKQSAKYKAAVRRCLSSEECRKKWDAMQGSDVTFHLGEFEENGTRGGYTRAHSESNSVEVMINTANSERPLWYSLAHEFGHADKYIEDVSAEARPDVDWEAERWPSISGKLRDPRPYSGEEFYVHQVAARIAAEVGLPVTLPYRPISPGEFQR